MEIEREKEPRTRRSYRTKNALLEEEYTNIEIKIPKNERIYFFYFSCVEVISFRWSQSACFRQI